MANFQNITGKKLAQAALTTSYVAIYTTLVNSRIYVKSIDIVNTTGSTKHIYVSLVPSGGSAGTSNAIFYNTLLPAYTTVQWTGAQIINEGDTIEAKADATGCTINVTGGEAV